MFIHYADGSSQEGAILGLKGDRMRVAMVGGDDVCEFVLHSGGWFSESLEVVSFSFPPGAGWQEQLPREVRNPLGVPYSPHGTSRVIQ